MSTAVRCRELPERVQSAQGEFGFERQAVDVDPDRRAGPHRGDQPAQPGVLGAREAWAEGRAPLGLRLDDARRQGRQRRAGVDARSGRPLAWRCVSQRASNQRAMRSTPAMLSAQYSPMKSASWVAASSRASAPARAAAPSKLT